MIYFFMLLGVALSIVSANGWFVVPTFCITFCWVISIAACLLYAFASSIAKSINKKLLDELNSYGRR